MEVESGLDIKSVDDFNYEGKTVLLRLDINSPIDPNTKKITGLNRIEKSLPTIKKLLDDGAKVVMIAHQGDTLDYQNLICMKEHSEILTEKLGERIEYIDDVAGPAAQKMIRELKDGEGILLGNLRYLTEEVSTFENAVKQKSEDMMDVYHVRNLAPLMDSYVNEAFSAAHRNSPSMVAFQRLLPTAGGRLLFEELTALTTVAENPGKPCVFILGGAKISDAFGMLNEVLSKGIADKILTCGVTGEVMLLADGISLGSKKEEWIKSRSLDVFVKDAGRYLNEYRDKLRLPIDLAYQHDGKRKEIDVSELPVEEMFMDIGAKTVDLYLKEMANAKTIFMNGPAGAYEEPLFDYGTQKIWNAVADSDAYTVIGGGDTVSAAQKFIDTSKINHVCTAGGAMVRFLSGKELPLVTAMKTAVKEKI